VPLPTVIEEMEGGRRWVSIPSEDVMCVEALESTTQGELPCSCMCCRAAMRPDASQVLVEVVEQLEDTCSGAKAVWACGEGPRMPWLHPAGAPGPSGAPEPPWRRCPGGVTCSPRATHSPVQGLKLQGTRLLVLGLLKKGCWAPFLVLGRRPPCCCC
jgi:hypothetical protein